MSNDDPHSHGDSVDLPTPTAWPIITAFGLTLVFFGLVTTLVISLIGFFLALIGAIGWGLDVFPHPKHDTIPFVPAEERAQEICRKGREVAILKVGEEGHREHVVFGAVHPYSAGAMGGLAGAVAMAVVACAWGLIFKHSIWFPVNLLAAVGDPGIASSNDPKMLMDFNAIGFIVATITHLTTSVLVGLLYTVILPMLPAKKEWFWGGIITPLFWSALIYCSIHIISPMFAENISWIAFIVSQIVFGLVCGYIVYKSARIEVMQSWPVAARLGVEAQHRDKE